MTKRVTVKLRAKHKTTLKELTAKGDCAVRVVKRAQLLLHMNEGMSAPQAAKATRVTAKTARNIANRYAGGNLERALFEDPRFGSKPLLTVKESQEIIAMVCSKPPLDQARWSVRLIVKEVIARGIVPRVGRETIRILLHSHELKPWREKNVGNTRNHARIHREDGRCAGCL